MHTRMEEEAHAYARHSCRDLKCNETSCLARRRPSREQRRGRSRGWGSRSASPDGRPPAAHGGWQAKNWHVMTVFSLCTAVVREHQDALARSRDTSKPAH